MFYQEMAWEYYRKSESCTIAVLNEAVGGLTQTSKMPWLSYSLPASACKTGRKLREVEGSVCSKCYACKGFYCMPNVRKAQELRRLLFFGDPERWAGYMARLIQKKASNITADKRYFRWHDSGDIQSAEHFAAIKWIARMVPAVQFYLPTKEREHKHRVNEHPYNLTVRQSAKMLRQAAPVTTLERWATVGRGDGYQCPAGEGNEYKCGDCRACWDSKLSVVDYAQH